MLIVLVFFKPSSQPRSIICIVFYAPFLFSIIFAELWLGSYPVRRLKSIYTRVRMKRSWLGSQIQSWVALQSLGLQVISKEICDNKHRDIRANMGDLCLTLNLEFQIDCLMHQFKMINLGIIKSRLHRSSSRILYILNFLM